MSITLISSDNKEFKLDEKFCKLSIAAMNWFESSSDPFKVEVSSDLLSIVVQYCEQHNYNPPQIKKPIKSEDLAKNLDPLDYKLVSGYDYLSIKPLLSAAFYLGFDRLREVCITVIATVFLSGDSIDLEKLKTKFQVTKDYTLEDEKEILEACPWAEDDFDEVKDEGMIEEESKA